MQKEFFVNASFAEKGDETVTITARLRGVSNAKSFKFSGVPKTLGLEQNDGVSIDLSGELSVSENYISVADYKVLDIKKGAYQPIQKVDAAELLKELEKQRESAPAHDDDDIPF